MSEPFYKIYQKLLADGKPLPPGVEISVGSMGSVFFTDSLSLESAEGGPVTHDKSESPDNMKRKT